MKYKKKILSVFPIDLAKKPETLPMQAVQSLVWGFGGHAPSKNFFFLNGNQLVHFRAILGYVLH